MKAQAIQAENVTVPVPGRHQNGSKTGAKNSHTETASDAAPSHMSASPNLQPEVVPDGSIKIPLDQIEVDGSIFPRASLDKYTVTQYASALIREEQLPPITIEAKGEGGYRVLKGVHRFEAYSLRRDIYAGKRGGDFFDDPLPTILATDLNIIPCFIETIPPDIHPMVLAMQDNLKHGKPLTSQDYKKVARQLYTDNRGAPVQELANLIKISRKVFGTYVVDLVEAFEKEKEELMLELDAKGVPGVKIARDLKKKFPKAKGISQTQVSKFLTERDTADKTNAEDSTGADIADGSQTVIPGEVQEGEEGTESTEATTKPFELEVVCGNLSDTIMIRGINSLKPHLQKKLKTEVQNLVNQIRAENQAKLKIKEQAKQAAPEPQDEAPDKAKIGGQSTKSSNKKQKAEKIRPAIQPTRGSRPPK
jgi:hypothetical protein